MPTPIPKAERAGLCGLTDAERQRLAELDAERNALLAKQGRAEVIELQGHVGEIARFYRGAKSKQDVCDDLGIHYERLFA